MTGVVRARSLVLRLEDEAPATTGENVMNAGSMLVGAIVLLGPLPAWAGGSAPDIGAGKAVYAAHCVMCHRADGSGGLKVGKTVSADLRSPGLENTYGQSDAKLMRAILEGKDEDGGDLDLVMPHWKGQITTAQATAVLAYVKTLCCHAEKENDDAK